MKGNSVIDETSVVKPEIQRAGEGGGLPKGLSLFRFILFSCLMTGALYGGASLYFNTPPLPGDSPPGEIPAAQWQPSPLWLPSFIAFQLRIGVRPSPIGYVFTGRMGHAAHGSASIFFGILLLGGVGWFAGETIRKAAVRKRYA